MNNFKDKYLKYKSKYLELKENIQKGGVLKEVYLPFFHSAQTDVEMIVPPGSTLVKLTMCGIAATSLDNHYKIKDIFYNGKPEVKEILRDPVKNIRDIEKLINTKPVIVNEGEKYEDMEFSLELFYPYMLNEGKCHDKLYPTNRDSFSNEINITEFMKLYENSVFPNMDLIIQILAENRIQGKLTSDIIKFSDFKEWLEKKIKELIKEDSFEYKDIFKSYGNTISISLHKLMEKFPGVYYITTCRVPKFIDQKIAPLIEKSLIRREMRMYNSLKDIYTTLKYMYSLEDINFICSHLYIFINKKYEEDNELNNINGDHFRETIYKLLEKLDSIENITIEQHTLINEIFTLLDSLLTTHIKLLLIININHFRLSETDKLQIKQIIGYLTQLQKKYSELNKNVYPIVIRGKNRGEFDIKCVYIDVDLIQSISDKIHL